MNRGTFFKRLFQGAAVVAVAPSVLSEISLKSSTAAIQGVVATDAYIAGCMNMNKQMTASLPWLQDTLPQMVMRDYMKRENAAFMNKLTQS